MLHLKGLREVLVMVSVSTVSSLVPDAVAEEMVSYEEGSENSIVVMVLEM